MDIQVDQNMLESPVEVSQLGYYVSLGGKLQDVLVISNKRGEAQSQVRVPLNPESPDKLVVVVKTVGGGQAIKVGSISFIPDIFFSLGQGRFTQWVTLFDHLDDDEYDGDFTETDEELPRV
jgi:hypothetical protein